MWELETEIKRLTEQVAGTEGQNVATPAFATKVDSLISVFYDDIGEIKTIPLKSLFDLFLLKALYVNRKSTSFQVLNYISDLLVRFLWSREMAFPAINIVKFQELLAALDAQMDRRSSYQNLFEASRRLGDNSLFMAGVFPHALARPRLGRRRRQWFMPSIDVSHYVNFGKSCYKTASEQSLAEWTGQRPVLVKLSSYFEIYADSLNEVSQRYILGFDMNLIADKLLDSLNLYRRTGEPKFLDNARKYAAILKVDSASFARFFRRRRSYRLI